MQKEKKDKHFIKKPVYPGGIQAMRKFIRENLRYPKEALKDGIEGTVKLKYTIDHTGKVIETKVLHSVGHGCDEEAERLAKMLRFEVPKNRKIKVQFHRDLQVHFRLPKQKAYAPKYAYQFGSTDDTKGGEGAKSSYNYTIVIGKKT